MERSRSCAGARAPKPGRPAVRSADMAPRSVSVFVIVLRSSGRMLRGLLPSRGWALAALWLAVSPLAPRSSLLAQSTAQRASLDAFRDSLAAVADSGPLALLERGMIDVARVQRDST